MFDTLRRFDRKTAAGLLAQAAMHLEGYTSSASEPLLVENQAEVEKSILAELRAQLGILPNDGSKHAIESLADALDRHADVFSEWQMDSAADRLGAEGLLPSDLYQITFSQALLNDFAWRWPIEEILATQTIKAPDKEQVLGPGVVVDDSAPLVTIFARYFRHKFPARSFWLVVLGERSGRTLIISQIWRAYPNTVDLSNCETLLDVVRAIADRFGQPIEIDGHVSKFFYRAKFDDLQKAEQTINVSLKPGEKVTITHFSGSHGSQKYLFLIIPISLTLYFRSVEGWRGWDRNLLDSIDLTRRDHRYASDFSATIRPTSD